MAIRKVIIEYFDRMAIIKDGGLTMLSGMLSVPFTISLNRLFEGVDYKHISILIVSQGIFLIIYSVFNTLDLLSGLRAARHKCELEKGRPVSFHEYWDKDKFLSTIWKYLAVIALTTIVIILACISEIIGMSYIYYAFLWFHLVLWLMANGYEFSSIGDNIQKRTGKKPRIFSWFEIILDKFSKKAIDKIDESSFNKIDR